MTTVVLGDINLVRALAVGGLRSHVLSTKADVMRRSRHVDGVVPYVEPWGQPDRLLDTLLAFAAGQDEPPLLLPQHDGALLALSRNRDRLAGHARVSLGDAELIERLVDKRRFQALAAEHGLPVPRSVPLAGATVGDIRLPAVVKPLTRSPGWEEVAPSQRGKARAVHSAEELAAVARDAAAVGLDAIVQEAVVGPESRIESYHAYVDPGGEVAGEFTGRKLRTWPIEFGESTAVMITEQPDVRELGREVLRAIALTGVAKVDFKRSVDGALHLLEVNPRFNLWHYPGAVAGVNLPALVVADLTGAPRQPAGRARAGVTWCQPVRDLRSARAQGRSVRSWLRFLAACEAPSNATLRDPLPFVVSMARRAVG